jgi:hypothetical protein
MRVGSPFLFSSLLRVLSPRRERWVSKVEAMSARVMKGTNTWSSRRRAVRGGLS